MSKMKFSSETPLYTSDGKAWRIDQFVTVMETLGALKKPIVLFVHGRGKEPGKSLLGATFTEGKAVHKIERGYDVSVLMFNWDSAFKGFNFLDREVPLSHTDSGGIALGKVLQAMRQFQHDRPNARKPTLLVHSMGSVVVQKTLTTGSWPETTELFSTVLFSQPDADDVGHATWLNMLASRERTYVTLNKDDHVLQRSNDARPPGAHALGLDTSQPLAPRATYVDISRMGALGKKDEDHEVFGKGAMNQQVHLCHFFTEALTGQSVVLDEAKNVESVDRGVVFRLRDKREPAADCLRVPKLPD